MKKFKQIIILFISISIITSCSIEKRHYRAGYFVSSFSKKDNATPKKKQDEKTESKNNDDLSTQPIVASTDNSIIIEKKESKVLIEKQNFEECDIIVLKNGDEIKAKVTDISPTEIKYKKCDEPNGATLYYKASEVFMIKYPNGTKEVINSGSDNGSNKNKTQSNSDDKYYDKNHSDRNGVDKKHADKKHSEKSTAVKRKTSKLCLWGFIFGCPALYLLLLAAFAPYVSLVLGLVAFVLGFAGLRTVKKDPETYRGKAFGILGVIFGLVAFLVGIIATIILFA